MESCHLSNQVPRATWQNHIFLLGHAVQTHLRGFEHLHLHVKSHWGCVAVLCNLCSVLNATHQQSSSQNISRDSPFSCFAEGRLPLHAWRSNGATEYVWNINAWSLGFEHVTFSQMPCNVLSTISWNIACSSYGTFDHLMWYFHSVFIAFSCNILWINTMSDKINNVGSGVFLLPVNKKNI